MVLDYQVDVEEGKRFQDPGEGFASPWEGRYPSGQGSLSSPYRVSLLVA